MNIHHLSTSFIHKITLHYPFQGYPHPAMQHLFQHPFSCRIGVSMDPHGHRVPRCLLYRGSWSTWLLPKTYPGDDSHHPAL